VLKKLIDERSGGAHAVTIDPVGGYIRLCGARPVRRQTYGYLPSH